MCIFNNMIGSVGIRLIVIRLNIMSNVYNNYKILRYKMINEKVFVYQYDTNHFVKNILSNENSIHDNIIIKIPNCYLDKNFYIGKIKIDKIKIDKIINKTSNVINCYKVNDFIKFKNKNKKL
jgi:hypothetical protein